MTPREVSVGHFETTDEMRELVNLALDNGRVSYGPISKQFEEKFADIHQVKHAILSASGTDALRAGLHALKIYYDWPDGAEVIVPATTFVATVNIVTQIGLKPVFVDVDDRFYCMDQSLVEDALTENTVAILPVNLLGQAADLSGLDVIAENNGIVMMEDSAEAMFINHLEWPVGSWGEVAGFSLYMAHLIASGVGGVTTTDNTDIAEIVRSLLNHGREPMYISIDDDDGLKGDALRTMVENRFRFIYPGYSSRITELQAAIALPQLHNYKEMLARRQAVASQLTAGLSKHARLQLPAEREPGEHSFMMYGIRMAGHEPKMPLVMHLEENGIETRDILPLLGQPIFEDWYDYASGGKPSVWQAFPVSASLVHSGFYIGCHPGITEDDVAYVCEVVDDFFNDS